MWICKTRFPSKEAQTQAGLSEPRPTYKRPAGDDLTWTGRLDQLFEITPHGIGRGDRSRWMGDCRFDLDLIQRASSRPPSGRLPSHRAEAFPRKLLPLVQWGDLHHLHANFVHPGNIEG